MPYRNGEIPKVGDRVIFDPENPIHLFRRRRGSMGKIYALGESFQDPIPSIVMVEWDQELPWPDDECYVVLLNRVN